MSKQVPRSDSSDVACCSKVRNPSSMEPVNAYFTIGTDHCWTGVFLNCSRIFCLMDAWMSFEKELTSTRSSLEDGGGRAA